MINAEQTTDAAFRQFGCFRAIVFSGVAGSQRNIGDVTIPAHWRSAEGNWAANPRMLRTASKPQVTTVPLAQDVPVGDAACLCPGVDAPTPVHIAQPLSVYVGGEGESADPFTGHAVPCAPGGGDIAGCKPCITNPGFTEDVAAFANNAPSLVTDPAFFQGLFRTETATTDNMDAQDEETAAVAKVAAEHHVPFLGVRAARTGTATRSGCRASRCSSSRTASSRATTRPR